MVPVSAADRDRWERMGSADLNRNLISEAVIGSLPKTMSLEDRSAIRNSVPKSPTLDIMSAMHEVRWCRLKPLLDAVINDTPAP